MTSRTRLVERIKDLYASRYMRLIINVDWSGVLESWLRRLLSHAGNARAKSGSDKSTSSKALPSFLFLFPTTSNLNNSTDVRPSELTSKALFDSTSISTEQYYENSGADGRAQLYCLVNPQAQSGVCSMHSYCNNSVGEAAQRKQQAQIFLPVFAEYDCDTCCLSKASWWV
jgi:hypothetical protein